MCQLPVIEHWPALLFFFNSHDDVEKPGRVKRCAAYLRDHEVRLYYHFLSVILQPLNNLNTMYQVDIDTYKIFQKYSSLALLNFMKFLCEFINYF